MKITIHNDDGSVIEQETDEYLIYYTTGGEVKTLQSKSKKKIAEFMITALIKGMMKNPIDCGV